MSKTILLILETRMRPGRSQLIGILRRINEERLDWDLRIIPSRSAISSSVLARASRRGVDGVIIAVPGGQNVPDRLARANHSVVFLDVLEPDISFNRRTKVFLHVDDQSISEAAAQHFLQLGNFRSFAFVHDSRREIWSETRAKAFAETLRKSGRDCFIHFGTDDPDRAGNKRKLAEFLSRLPRPAAVMGACDSVAATVLQACASAGITVPEEIAVLGVDNDELICECQDPPLSSIEPDFEEEGFRAAGVLAELLKAPLRNARTAKPNLRFVERKSTHPLPPATRLVERALKYIAENYTNPIGVGDVAHHLGVSRRLADLRFHQLERETILETITRYRFERLRKELIGSNKSIANLIKECGFGSVTRATHLFKERFGMSMSAYRNRSQR